MITDSGVAGIVLVPLLAAEDHFDGRCLTRDYLKIARVLVGARRGACNDLARARPSQSLGMRRILEARAVDPIASNRGLALAFSCFLQRALQRVAMANGNDNSKTRAGLLLLITEFGERGFARRGRMVAHEKAAAICAATAPSLR